MLTGQYRKKIYDDTATVIMDLFMTGRISSAESHCLLNLLEAVMTKPHLRELIILLKQWQPDMKSSEVDDIIKATLLALDYEDKDDVEHSMALLSELINLRE